MAVESDNLEECGLCHDLFGLGQIEFDGVNWLCPKCRRALDNLSEIADRLTETGSGSQQNTL